MIEIARDCPVPEVDDAALTRAAEAALTAGGRAGADLSIVLVDEETLTAMHAEHLDDPTPTDVITFDLGEDPPGPIGELYVSVDRAREVSKVRGVPFERELALYVVHGALHLCGYDDHEAGDRARMRELEGRVLGGLGFGVDDAPHDLP